MEDINFTKGTIIIEATEHRGLKSEDSAAEVQIDPVLAEELRKFKPAGDPLFVIDSPLRARLRIDHQSYRAEPVFQRLYVWLRSKGIKNRCPLHTLRKEYGSLINANFGLYAAMSALRHSSIAITAGHYTDNKRRIALPMADNLSGPQPAPENHSSKNHRRRNGEPPVGGPGVMSNSKSVDQIVGAMVELRLGPLP